MNPSLEIFENRVSDLERLFAKEPSVGLVDQLLTNLVAWAERAYPEVAGSVRFDVVLAKLKEIVERYDHTLPLLGEIMDFPVVDWLEDFLLRQAVERAFGLALLEGWVSSSRYSRPV